MGHLRSRRRLEPQQTLVIEEFVPCAIGRGRASRSSRNAHDRLHECCACSSGMMLEAMSRLQSEAWGIEPDEAAARSIARRLDSPERIFPSNLLASTEQRLAFCDNRWFCEQIGVVASAGTPVR
jgi:hypothetical protein